MQISKISIYRPIFATMVIGAMVVFGFIAYSRIGVSLFPDVDFPIVTVTVIYEGADPETVESDVTDVIEEGVNTISGIKSLRSESTEGLAQVFVEFELERNIDVASQEVRDKVSSIRGDLPTDIEPPIVEKFDPDSAPILSIVLSGPDSIRTLTRYADEQLKPRIEGIEGVGSVRLVGGRDREVRIWLRLDQLRAYNLAAQDVIDALQDENVEFPGGRIETPQRELVVKTKGEVERVTEFGELTIAKRQSGPIYLKDVAYVEDGMKDFRSLSRLNGERAVSLMVRRQSGTNLLAVAEAVKEQLGEVQQSLPQGYEIVLAQDLSIFVSQSVDEAQGELLRGGTLAVLVILLFLRSWRGSFVAAVTIPTTIIATYACMLGMGFTLNMMSLLALTISVGMIVDDSIVVLENSYRHMEDGMSRMQAALAGISEIGFAVVATSLAISAVFIPVAFMEGLVGRFFFEFGLTVTFAVIISTFIALTLSPMLCSRVLKVSKKHGRIFNFLESIFTELETFYRASLRVALRFRVIVLLIAGAVFVGSIMLVPFIGTEFVPAQDEAQFNIQVESPLGSSIERTARILSEVESRVSQLPYVTNLYMTIGAGEEGRVNVATVLVQLVPKDQRDLGQQDIMTLARDTLADLTHSKISVENIPRVSGGGFRSAPLQYNLRGSDLVKLEDTAEEMIERIRQVSGVVDVNTTYNPHKPEVAVNPKRERIADLGVNVDKLGRAVRTLVGGQEVTTFEDEGETFDVRVRLAESQRNRAAAIRSLPVRTASGDLVELHDLVEVEEGVGPVQIDRQDRQRQITIMGNLAEAKPLGAAIQDINSIEQEVGLPEGIATAYTGAGDMMAESFASINFSLFLAIVLIYMILASQFESLIHPLTIMLSLPLSIGGALGGLWLTGRTLNIFSMIGMIMLMGLVTKNAILLVDYTNLLRKEHGLDRDEALLRAGPVRLRPILMTAFSTIAGMLPIAIGIGAGSETRAPMGTCVVGGMITSTMLTLIIIPVMYSLMDQWGTGLRNLIWRASDEEVATNRDEVALPVQPPSPNGDGEVATRSAKKGKHLRTGS